MKQPSLVARTRVSRWGELSKNALICERLASRRRALPFSAPAAAAGRDRTGLFTCLSASLLPGNITFQDWGYSSFRRWVGLARPRKHRRLDPGEGIEASTRVKEFRCALPILHDTIMTKAAIGAAFRRELREWHDGRHSRYRRHALSRSYSAGPADGRVARPHAEQRSGSRRAEGPGALARADAQGVGRPARRRQAAQGAAGR